MGTGWIGTLVNWLIPDWYREGQKRRGTGYRWLRGPKNDSGHHAFTACAAGLQGNGQGIVVAAIGNLRELVDPNQWTDVPYDVFANNVGALAGDTIAKIPLVPLLPPKMKYWIADYVADSGKSESAAAEI